MIQKTRALQRAARAASARSALTSRRPILLFGTATAALLGIALTTGIVSAPAAGDQGAGAGAVVRLFDATPPPAKVADGAVMTLSDARDAVAAAEAMNTEVASSGLAVEAAQTAVDTDRLAADIDRLEERDGLSSALLTRLTENTEREIHSVTEATETLGAALTAAREKKAADEAAATAAAEAEAAAAALAAANTPDGAKQTARQLASSRYGWGDDQFSCLDSLWTKESSWNYQAYNPSGATGIPQALPGDKMASAGADWQTNAATQIAWGLGYIASVYGTPCVAWSHSQATNWY